MIPESKLDHTVPDSEVKDVIFSDVIEIETSVMLLVTLGRICTSTQELCIAKKLKIFFDILLAKSKPITIGVFYRPLNQAEFMDLIVETFSNLNVKDNKIYLSVVLKLIFFKTVIPF